MMMPACLIAASRVAIGESVLARPPAMIEQIAVLSATEMADGVGSPGTDSGTCIVRRSFAGD